MSPSQVSGQPLSPRLLSARVLQVRAGPMDDNEAAGLPLPTAADSQQLSRQHKAGFEYRSSPRIPKQPSQAKASWQETMQLAELYLQRQKYAAGLAALEPLLLSQPSQPDVHCLHGKLLANLDNKARVSLALVHKVHANLTNAGVARAISGW